eukprot:TRINITY_DN76690_c0_g1_i1.p1 TRINITY_DN76690_c0_g1~~TRINITY_DN76690_c0_g1_i1.p1  ORF type:complete len:154 (-),score=36.65 TRINITY_DN76690_c0_g1_i1:62-523(-)
MSQSSKPKFTQESHFKKSDAEYGKPQEGTKTAARGRKAHQAISGEIVELCQVIQANARITGEDGVSRGILFGDLFNIYNSISNKVVGLLLRARKYKLVQFEGETLFQGRDNKTPVFLIRSIDEVKSVFKSGEDPTSFQWGVIGRQLDEPQDNK